MRQRIPCEDCLVAGRMHKQLVEVGNIPLFGIKLAQGECQRDPKIDSRDMRVDKDYPYSPASLVLEFAPFRCKQGRLEINARKLRALELGGKVRWVYIGSPNQLKGALRATPDREVGEFQETDPRVEDGSLEVSNIGRRVHPPKPGVAEKLPAIPVADRDDGQIKSAKPFLQEKLCQFAGCHPVTDGNFMIAGKSTLTIEERALHE